MLFIFKSKNFNKKRHINPSLANKIFLINRLLTLLLATLIAVGAQATEIAKPTPQTITIGALEEFDLRLEYGATESTQEIYYPGAAFIKVHIQSLNLQEGDYLSVSNPSGTEEYRYPGSAYTQDGEPGFWALSISGDRVMLRLQSNTEPPADGAAVNNVIIDKFTRGFGSPEEIMAANPTTESRCGALNYRDAICYEQFDSPLYEQSKPVARLLLNNGQSLCSGWRIAPNNDRMLTNEHCLSTQSGVEALEAWFNYQNPLCGRRDPVYFTEINQPIEEDIVKVVGNQLLIEDFTYDVALFTIQNPEQVTEFGALTALPVAPIQDEIIYIPHHPEGGPKKISSFSDQNRLYCRVDVPSAAGRTTGSDFGYFCDTKGGSSGSPVLAKDSHQVLGLHHYGGCPNQAVRMDKIWPIIEPFL